MSLSRNSCASNCPVDAPLGAMPVQTVPQASRTSASTVGFPRESSTCRPMTLTISVLLIETPPFYRFAVGFAEWGKDMREE